MGVYICCRSRIWIHNECVEHCGFPLCWWIWTIHHDTSITWELRRTAKVIDDDNALMTSWQTWQAWRTYKHTQTNIQNCSTHGPWKPPKRDLTHTNTLVTLYVDWINSKLRRRASILVFFAKFEFTRRMFRLFAHTSVCTYCAPTKAPTSVGATSLRGSLSRTVRVCVFYCGFGSSVCYMSE